MAIPLYCTTTDLSREAGGDTALAKLAADNRPAPWTLTDADVSAALTQAMEDTCSDIYGELAGKVDSATLSAPAAGSVAAIQLRKAAVAGVLQALWKRKGQAEQAKPYTIARSEAMSRLKRIGTGEIKLGETGQPTADPWISTSESDTEYSDPATGSGACQSSKWRGW